MYFIDTVLLCYLLRISSVEDLILSPHKGAIVETYAISELLKQRTNLGKKPNLSYFRDTRGFEIDTIADWNHTFAIEIKSSSETEKKLSANTRKYLSLRNDENAKRIILYLVDITCNINDITYVNWKDWGDFPKE